MLARKTCCGDPNAGIATRFPWRSRTARICPVANSSKQPTCRPPKKTTGSPGEAFALEKLLRHELRRDAEAGPVVQPDSRRLQWGLFGKPIRSIEKPCGGSG